MAELPISVIYVPEFLIATHTKKTDNFFVITMIFLAIYKYMHFSQIRQTYLNAKQLVFFFPQILLKLNFML